MSAKATPAPKRFWLKVEKTDLCWHWTGTTLNGYGMFWNGRRHMKAHRFAYEQVVGAIPPGLQLDHLCRNKLCVNPEHLEPVTNAENAQRGAMAKLTWKKVREIRASPESTAVVGRRYGVHPTTIGLIRNGKVWKEREMTCYLVAQRLDRVRIKELGRYCGLVGIVADERPHDGPSVTARDCSVRFNDGVSDGMRWFHADDLDVLPSEGAVQ